MAVPSRLRVAHTQPLTFLDKAQTRGCSATVSRRNHSACRYVTLIRANISRGDQEKEQEGGKGTSLAARVEDGSVRKKRTKEETSIARRRRHRVVAFHESAVRWRQHSLREALLGSAPALATSSWLLRVGSVGASSSCCACGMVY